MLLPSLCPLWLELLVEKFLLLFGCQVLEQTLAEKFVCGLFQIAVLAQLAVFHARTREQIRLRRRIFIFGLWTLDFRLGGFGSREFHDLRLARVIRVLDKRR